MSNNQGKHALMGHQASAATAALDFASAQEALSQAFAAAKVVKGEAAAETVADTIAKRADFLLSIPTRDPAQIGEKVSAFGWLHNLTPGPLSAPEVLRRVAASESEAAKGLLAIYLDLTAPPLSATMEERGTGESLTPALMARGTIKSDRAEWEAALAKYEAAAAARDRIGAEEHETGRDMADEWAEAQTACREALATLLATRAPDGVAMGVKARLVIEHQHTFYTSDDVADPAFLSELLAEGWDEALAASVYQDGLALAGVGGPVVEAKASAFDPESWLDVIEAETGSRMVRSDAYSPRVHFEGGDAEAATARLEALRHRPRNAVEIAAFNRIKGEAYAAAGPVPERIPSSTGELQAIFARGLLNCTPEDQREALLASLAAFGIDPARLTEGGEA